MEQVFSPWTPIQVAIRGSELGVQPWGRMYVFSGVPLPSRIVTAGVELLSSPIRLVGEIGGEPLAWKETGVTLLREDDGEVTLCGWLSCEHMVINIVTTIEFDGLVRVDMAVMPRANSSPRPEKLWLEAPLRRERAGLYHYWPGRWGSGENSGAVPASGLLLPFKPFVWLGWEEGGLGWISESDKGWASKDQSRCIEVTVEGDSTLLRLHLLDSPPSDLPLSISFGFQATPVKPLPAGFHEQRTCHGAQFGMEKTPFTQGEPETMLDRISRLGVKTLIFHEDWTPIENYWETDRGAELKELIAACHERGIKLLLYFGYLFSSLAPEWCHSYERSRHVTVGETRWFPYQRKPDQWAYVVCQNSEWQDRMVEGMTRALDRYGFDGVYLDGTIEPFDCGNEEHGCGYRARDGTLRATYPVFAVRRLMKRIYGLIHSRGGIVNAHQSTCCLTPTLSFCDSYWDGEQFMGGELAGDMLRNLPLETFRAEFMGRNFGVPCEFLVYERPPDWTFDHALAVTLLHDVRVRPWGFGDQLEATSRIWDAMSGFGVGDSEWHPYWRNAQSIHVEPDTVKASYYLRRDATVGKVRVLLVVSNLSPAREAKGLLSLRIEALGKSASFAAATDALTGEHCVIRGNALEIALKPMRARLVLLEQG